MCILPLANYWRFHNEDDYVIQNSRYFTIRFIAKGTHFVCLSWSIISCLPPLHTLIYLRLELQIYTTTSAGIPRMIDVYFVIIWLKVIFILAFLRISFLSWSPSKLIIFGSYKNGKIGWRLLLLFCAYYGLKA